MAQVEVEHDQGSNQTPRAAPHLDPGLEHHPAAAFSRHENQSAEPSSSPERVAAGQADWEGRTAGVAEAGAFPTSQQARGRCRKGPKGEEREASIEGPEYDFAMTIGCCKSRSRLVRKEVCWTQLAERSRSCPGGGLGAPRLYSRLTSLQLRRIDRPVETHAYVSAIYAARRVSHYITATFLSPGRTEVRSACIRRALGGPQSP